MPRDSAAADRPASYLVGTAAAFPLFFRDRTKPINQLPFSPSTKFPKSGSSCESRAKIRWLRVLRRRREAPQLLQVDLCSLQRQTPRWRKADSNLWTRWNNAATRLAGGGKGFE